MKIINHYFPSIMDIVRLLKELENSPMKKSAVCGEIQEKLIVQLTRVESRIRKRRLALQYIKQALADKNAGNSREVSKSLKAKAKLLKEQVDEYHFIRILYKSLGDGVAFTYINRFDLKGQNFKQGPGFISGKKGSRLERRCFRAAIASGGIAIMNDLTNVLKYFDLTVVPSMDDWVPIELKSGRTRNKVQEEKGNLLLRYLKKDEPADIYGRGQVMVRQELTSKIRDHIQKFNSNLKKVRKKGCGLVKFEKGHYMMAVRDGHTAEFEKLLATVKMEYPLIFHQNEYLVTEMGYFPYCLQFDFPQDYIDFLSGELQIYHFFDLETLRDIADGREYDFEFVQEEERYVSFMKRGVKEMGFAVSYHSFARIFFELISPSWLFNDHFVRYEQMVSLFEEHPEKFSHLLPAAAAPRKVGC